MQIQASKVHKENLFPSAPPAHLRTLRASLTNMTIPALTARLTQSLRKPTGRTLTLIDKALSYLAPFEQEGARTTSASERMELLDLISTHRWTLCPYVDVDRIESNLRYGEPSS